MCLKLQPESSWNINTTLNWKIFNAGYSYFTTIMLSELKGFDLKRHLFFLSRDTA